MESNGFADGAAGVRTGGTAVSRVGNPVGGGLDFVAFCTSCSTAVLPTAFPATAPTFMLELGGFAACMFTALFYHYNGFMKIVRAAMIGDVVGEAGLKALEQNLPAIIKDNAVDFTVVNGENSADGFGMTEAALNRILTCGVDAVTSGNHIWEKRDFWQILNTANNVLRPANYPGDSPGRGWFSVEKAGVNWLIINVQGREHMTPIDCPFRCFDNIINNLTVANPLVLVDFHAESSREKEALGHYLDGRATLVAGTHTHVQTADERLLPKGTAYITDLGMSGNINSVIGMDPQICLDRTRKQVLYRMEPAPEQPNAAAVQGIIAEIDAETGKAVAVRRV